MASADMLEKVKNDIGLSKEWKEFHQRLTDEFDDSTKHKKNLTTEQRALLVKRVVESVKESEQYKQLEERVPSVVQLHFYSNPKTKKLKAKTPIMDRASATIVQRWPRLKSHLKQFINVPLPTNLRKAAWSAFLQDKTIRKYFLTEHEGMRGDDLLNKDPKLTEKCKKYLQREVFIELKKTNAALHTMCAVLKFWQKKSGSEVTDPEILLSIPFTYCYRDELGSSSKTLNTSSVSIVAEMFCSFMQMIPLSMKSALHEPKVHQQCSVY